MEYEWDEAKREANLARHGLDFALATDFDWSQAVVLPDTRENYGEQRYVALAPIRERVHVMAFTPRNARVRIIGLRKANLREQKRYEQEARSH